MADSIKLTLNDVEVLRRLDETEFRTTRTLVNAARAAILFLIRWVVTRKLLGQSLGRVTGTAIRNVTASPRIKPARSSRGRATAYMGTNLGYVVRHDQGFDGTDRIPEHTRSGVRVRAHERRVHVRARHFFGETFDEGAPGVNRRLVRGIRLLLRTGQVPSMAEIHKGA